MAKNAKGKKRGGRFSNRAPWIRQLGAIQAAAKRDGLEVRVLNGGYHFQFVGGPFLVNWYPSTETIYIDGTKWKTSGSWNAALSACKQLPKAIQRKAEREATSVKGERKRIRREKLKANPHCHFCGLRLTTKTASLEHIIPASRGGLDGGSNLALSCYPCNWTKGDKVQSNRAKPAEPRADYATIDAGGKHVEPPRQAVKPSVVNATKDTAGSETNRLPDLMFSRMMQMTYRVDRRRLA